MTMMTMTMMSMMSWASLYCMPINSIKGTAIISYILLVIYIFSPHLVSDACSTLTCLNGGTCQPLSCSVATCQCPGCYTGPNCELCEYI